MYTSTIPKGEKQLIEAMKELISLYESSKKRRHEIRGKYVTQIKSEFSIGDLVTVSDPRCDLHGHKLELTKFKVAKVSVKDLADNKVWNLQGWSLEKWTK